MIRAAFTLMGLVIIVSVASLLIHLGAFRPVEIQMTSETQFLLLGKDHLGPYHKINSVIQEVEAWAKENEIDCKKTFGLYFDHPDRVEEERLKSLGGCVLETAPSAVPSEFRLHTFKAPATVHAIFQGSPAIGPQKVYSKVQNLLLEKRLATLPGVLEIYDIKNDKEMDTHYYFPLQQPLSN